jgi:hypothetical protein
MATDDQPRALALPYADHLRVRSLFQDYHSLRGLDAEDARKAELVDDLCYELTVHSMLEEEIFYPMPAARRAPRPPD